MLQIRKRSLVVVLALVLLSAPAFAAQAAPSAAGAAPWSWLSGLYQGFYQGLARVVGDRADNAAPRNLAAATEAGPGMDPDGLAAGPGMDPNGLTGGPEMDPNGASADAGPSMDPNG